MFKLRTPLDQPARLKRVALAGLSAGSIALATFACVSPPLESPPSVVVQQTSVRVAQNIRNKVDLLFLIDNSSSMEAMSLELRNRFGEFFKVFRDLSIAGTNADLHIGVVTSDYGAGATGSPGCTASPGGDLGRLQALGKNAANGCLPPTGKNYIEFAFTGPNMGTGNLPLTQNLEATFTCMASVGTSGCGFEHQLESVYAALHNNLTENAGFLRDDALLTVVFVTNEDDASAPPNSEVFDRNQVAKFGFLSTYRQTRYGVQCLLNGTAHLTPYGDSGGPMSGCQAATMAVGSADGFSPIEYDIDRYVSFFSKPGKEGGIKVNPLDVILVAINAPEDPVQIILTNPGTPGGTPFTQCSPLNESSMPPCVPALQHSCQNSRNPAFFGDPPIRLNTVIRSAKGGHQITSICDDDYSGALAALGKLIVSTIGGGCLSTTLVAQKTCDAQTGCVDVACGANCTPCKVDGDCGAEKCVNGACTVAGKPCGQSDCSDDKVSCFNAEWSKGCNLSSECKSGHCVANRCVGRCVNPDCVVEDVTQLTNGDTKVVQIPRCDTVMTKPCWKMEGKDACAATSPDGVGLTIDRGGVAADPNTDARVACTTLAM